MHTPTSNKLSCSLYGHNLERSSNTAKNAHKLRCKTCSAEIPVSIDGEFDAHPIKNRRLISALKDYVFLKNSRLGQRLSY